MLENILQLDLSVFEWINTRLSNSFFDMAFPILREKTSWIPFYLFVIVWSIFSFNLKKGMIYILVIISLIGMTDFISSTVLKKSIERPRPCHVVQIKESNYILVPCGAGYSFPSSHAANHFALAIFLILSLKRKYSWIVQPLFIWASLISIAQIYVGVHYPLDVVGGAILGTCLAFLIYTLYKKLILKKNPLY